MAAVYRITVFFRQVFCAVHGSRMAFLRGQVKCWRGVVAGYFEMHAAWIRFAHLVKEARDQSAGGLAQSTTRKS